MSNNNQKTLMFTGKRPKDLFGYNNTKDYKILMEYIYDNVKKLFLTENYVRFISGGAAGFDQCAYRAVHKLKKEYPNDNIKNILYLPCKNQDEYWQEEGLFGKKEYKKIIESADEVKYISEEYSSNCMLKRNDAMIENSDGCFALHPENPLKEGGTEYTLKKAKEKGLTIYEYIYNKDNIIGSLTLKYTKNLLNTSVNNNRNVNDTISLFGQTKGLIVQQVNCCGVMGAGLAQEIAIRFPQVKKAFDNNYKNTIDNTNKDNRCHIKQLGTYEIIPLNENKENLDLAVVNIYSQDNYGNPNKTNKIYTKIDILINCIEKIAKDNPNLNVYIPIGIGCGYGGESWNKVEKRLKELKLTNLKLIDTYTWFVSDINKINEDKDINR